MIVSISSDAEADLAERYWFYERQSPGLGDYVRSCFAVVWVFAVIVLLPVLVSRFGEAAAHRLVER